MILKIIIALSLTFSFVYSTPIKQVQKSQNDTKEKVKYEVKFQKLKVEDSDSVLNSSIYDSFRSPNFKIIHPVCGEVYESKINSGGEVIQKFTKPYNKDYETVLEDFNPYTGNFICNYISKEDFSGDLISANSLEGWKSRLKMIELDEKNTKGRSIIFKAFRSIKNGDAISGDYFIPNVRQFFENSIYSPQYRYNESNFDVYEKASKLGLWIDNNTNISKQEKNFTLSQFLIALITLNSDVVVGVDGYGNIKINKDIEKRLTILHEQDGDGGDLKDIIKIKDNYIGTGITGILFGGNLDNLARKKYTDTNSFLDYFNFKLFGMYYNFMGIAWSNIFAYASMLFLSFMVLYSGVIVGVKYGVHKLDENTKGRPFEFPAKIRLISIGAVLVLSFVQFPSGDGVKITNSKGELEKIQSQTSIAKITISYLGNIGTTIADISAGNSITVYLDYLLKATNSRGYKQIKENIKEYEKEVAVQAVRVSFFANECVIPYSNKKFKSEKSFQGVNSSNINDWVWQGDSDAKKIFSKNTKDPSVSPYLCKKLEKNIAITRKILKAQQAIIEKDMDARKITERQTNGEELSRLFVITQLHASKSLGWINIASLPILHVFMMNSGIIGGNYGLGKKGEDQMKSMILDSSLQNQDESNKQLTKEAKNYLKGKHLGGLYETGSLDEFIVWVLSKQVYSLLPGFDDTRQGIQTLIKGSVETLLDLLSKVMFAGKALSIAKKVNNFVSSDDSSTSVGLAGLLYLISFSLAIVVYKIMLSAIFGGMVSLLIILKIVLYFIDVFAYFFVSPLIIGWKLTINDRTDKVHKYITSGFVLLLLKPTLIVFSSVMFIIAYEIMLSVYSLSFDMVFSSLELANDLYDESDLGSLIMMGAIKGFGEVMILVFGMYLAYQIILNGDDIILQKFGYKDDMDNGMANQLGGKIQGIAGGKI